MNLYAVCIYLTGGERDGENVLDFVNAFNEKDAEERVQRTYTASGKAESYLLNAVAVVPFALLPEVAT